MTRLFITLLGLLLILLGLSDIFRGTGYERYNFLTIIKEITGIIFIAIGLILLYTKNISNKR